MRILLSSVGRRGYLVKFFKDELGSNGEVWGADNDRYASAFHCCDNHVLLPEVTDPDYAEQLMQFCQDNHIDMVVPLIDPELEVLAAQRERFYDAGTMVVVSPPQTIQIASDKYLTYKFARDNGIGAAETVLSIEQAEQLLDSGGLKWPLAVKHRKGSASQHIYYCHKMSELKFAFEQCPMPMIQQFVEGQEYNYDIFGDSNYRPISVFCKRKIAMRAGETDKAVSVNDPDLTNVGLKIIEALQLFGPCDVDLMVDDGGPKLLEMNPRFGGGYPCAHLCGANFPAKLISMFRNETLTPDIGSCPAGTYMLKQDEIISPDAESIRAIQDCRGEGSQKSSG